MKNALCSAVGFVRKFGGCKTAEVLAFAAKSNLGIPFPSRPVQGDAKQTAGFIADWCSPLVLLIGAVAGLSQVRKTIVCPVAVHVVNLLRRPFARHVEPRKAVRFVRVSGATDAPIPIAFVQIPGPLPVATTWATFGSCEYARLGVVVKKFAQTLRGKIGLSHDALLMLIGQRPACVSAHGGLRYFSGSHASLRGADRRSV